MTIATRGERFCRNQRILRRAEYQRIQTAGLRVRSQHYVWLIQRSAGAVHRLGITASRRLGNAVTRNRIKRVLREVFRRNQTMIATPCDIVVIPRSTAGGLTYQEALEEWKTAALRINRVLLERQARRS